ncbi:MAG: PilZ domain-containing protein [Nitrospirae bacterium]|nr:PilZ domain-containing protein [Nitrospirota bacterium]
MDDIDEIEIPQKPPDKRRYLRDPIIIFKVAEDALLKPLFGYAKDISRGGLFVASINPRNPGDRFNISFQIPDTDIKVRCQCEVIWARRFSKAGKLEPGYGVRFTDIPEEIAVSIDNWVSSHVK